MRDKLHYQDMLSRNPEATFGHIVAARAVYATRYGNAEMDTINHDQRFRVLLRDIHDRYGKKLSSAEVKREMDKKE
jgi:hypothetical protein